VTIERGVAIGIDAWLPKADATADGAVKVARMRH
jgi:hypothetical protein